MSVKLSESTAMTLYKHLRGAWVSGDCTAELDAAMRVLDGQLSRSVEDRTPSGSGTSERTETMSEHECPCGCGWRYDLTPGPWSPNPSGSGTSERTETP